MRTGLSWFLCDKAGYRIVSHGGEDTGCRTNFVMYREAGGAVIVLSHHSGPDDTVTEVTRLAFELAVRAE